jgi:protein-tyrosine phosphatase
MRAIIPDLLWIGTAIDACNIKAVLDLGITAVVDLAIEEKPVIYPREITYCRIPMVDGGGNPSHILRLALDTTASLLRQRVPTLVACAGGMSRSPAIAAAALALVRGTSPEAMLEEIAKHGAHDVVPGLWAEIEALASEK